MFTIYHDIEITASASAIFEMISKPINLDKWWTIKSQGSPELNTDYNFFFSNQYNWFATVAKVTHNQKITYKMINADNDWTGTELEFEILKKSESQHILRFEHRNWKNSNAHYRRTSYCWAIYFQKLKSILEMK